MEAVESTNISYTSQLEETKNYLLSRTDIRPKVGIICGTGLGFLELQIEDSVSFPYQNVPRFPECTTKGHSGNLVFGYISRIPVMCMVGRFHFFEGYTPQQCAMPIRIMKMMGVTHLLISNSGGALNPTFKVGNIMIIKDHVNFVGMSGFNPLRGLNLDDFGPRFPPMNGAYNLDLIDYALEVAAKENFSSDVCVGVYGCVGGPCYETVAEINMLKMLGMDAVGMSTVHEVIAARHCNMTVFAFTVITNICCDSYHGQKSPNHEEICTVGETQERILKKLVTEVVERMGEVR